MLYNALSEIKHFYGTFNRICLFFFFFPRTCSVVELWYQETIMDARSLFLRFNSNICLYANSAPIHILPINPQCIQSCGKGIIFFQIGSLTDIINITLSIFFRPMCNKRDAQVLYISVMVLTNPLQNRDCPTDLLYYSLIGALHKAYFFIIKNNHCCFSANIYFLRKSKDNQKKRITLKHMCICEWGISRLDDSNHSLY